MHEEGITPTRTVYRCVVMHTIPIALYLHLHLPRAIVHFTHGLLIDYSLTRAEATQRQRQTCKTT